MNSLFRIALCGCMLLLFGCEQPNNNSTALNEKPLMDKPAMDKLAMDKPMMDKPSMDIQFKDEVATNAKLPENIDELSFVDSHGKQVELNDFAGKKNVVLVFTRGFSGTLCPFCRTQSSRLVSNYEKFAERDAEVLLVYPGGSDHLEQFIDAAKASEKEVKLPFPVLLDPDLKAVNFLQIAAEKALPSTYILDKQGNIRFAYVGDNPSDRPSVDALLKQLDLLSQ